MQKSTRCMQSMHVRSRLILISVTRGIAVTVQSSVLILRDYFARRFSL
jgi:hypothetical protein